MTAAEMRGQPGGGGFTVVPRGDKRMPVVNSFVN
jgi:hypothetical protein